MNPLPFPTAQAANTQRDIKSERAGGHHLNVMLNAGISQAHD